MPRYWVIAPVQSSKLEPFDRVWEFDLTNNLISIGWARATGTEPVREWLLALKKSDRKTIGEDVKTVQFGWPLGMPLVRKLESELWEVRSRIEGGFARVIFTV